MTRIEPGSYTANDLLAPQYGDLDFELWDGTLLLHDWHQGYASPICAELGYLLTLHVRPGNLGWLAASAGFRVQKNPDRLLVPDVSFTSRERLPAWPREGWTEAVPDLVAEVRNPDDSWESVLAKGGIWIAHGVRVVWLVNIHERTVTTLRPAQDPVETGLGGTFSGAPALPDLSIAVADLFRGLS